MRAKLPAHCLLPCISDLAGWQLDKLAANPKTVVEDDSSDEEDIPWACFVCRKPYADPVSHSNTILFPLCSRILIKVVTRCGHYFCSACAIKRFGKTPKCAACGTPTGGIFNRADKVIERMREKERQKNKDEEAGENDNGEAGGLNVDGLKEDEDSDEEDEEDE